MGEVKKSTFLVVARHCEIIFCLLMSPKCDLDEVDKTIFQEIKWHFEDIL